jgi:hypothetical protein
MMAVIGLLLVAPMFRTSTTKIPRQQLRIQSQLNEWHKRQPGGAKEPISLEKLRKEYGYSHEDVIELGEAFLRLYRIGVTTETLHSDFVALVNVRGP